jgi:hypothetical protein
MEVGMGLDELALKGLEARIRIIREGERHIVGPPTIAVGVDLLEMLVAAARVATTDLRNEKPK